MKPTTGMLTIIILTYNESLHIRRALASAFQVSDQVLIVDSYSTDDTKAIAQSLGARVVQHAFVNQAQQLQWALGQDLIQTPWIMRMDADEYLTDSLIQEIKSRLDVLPAEVSGVVLKRQVHFMGRWIKHGGYYPTSLLRIWRTGHAVIEQRWMDEHTILTQGTSVTFQYDFVDDNLNTLTWWTQKHNQYSTREAADILNRKYNLSEASGNAAKPKGTQQAVTKRWYKNNVYLRLPLFFRAFLYFQYRYWIKLGILDGAPGLIWHFLQGFWYRFLVDAKLAQIEYWAKSENKSIKEVLEEKYQIRFDTSA